MTYPNDLGLALPAAIQNVAESSVVMRVGTVADIQEADNITVKISGSDVLLQASYLFPLYLPMLGDRVVVHRQDSQWFVLGTMSGPINSLAPNPSFEDGSNGVTPASWTAVAGAIAAGTPTFVKDAGLPLTGSSVGHLSLAATGIGSSDMVISSASVIAAPGSQWTGGIFLRNLDLAGPNALLVFTGVRFFNSSGASLGLQALNTVANFTASSNEYTLIRPDQGTQRAIAPAGTARVALEIQVLFNIADPSLAVDTYMDAAILRQVG